MLSRGERTTLRGVAAIMQSKPAHYQRNRQQATHLPTAALVLHECWMKARADFDCRIYTHTKNGLPDELSYREPSTAEVTAKLTFGHAGINTTVTNVRRSYKLLKTKINIVYVSGYYCNLIGTSRFTICTLKSAL